jgi:hypothetical protein
LGGHSVWPRCSPPHSRHALHKPRSAGSPSARSVQAVS